MNKDRLYTRLGWFINAENKFKTIEGEFINCLVYRHLNREMGNNLVAVNMRYIAGYVNNWVIFQTTILDDFLLE